MSEAFRNSVYLIAAVMFIFGLRGLSHPRTAVRGNMIGVAGMLLAAIVTVIDQRGFTGGGWILIVVGVLAGAVAGLLLATRIQMTSMPQMVALLNGFGGIASVLVAGAALHELITPGSGNDLPADLSLRLQAIISIGLSGLVGGVTFTGSLIAYGKLEEWKSLDRMVFPAQKVVNGALIAVTIALGALHALNPQWAWVYWLLVVVAFILGVLLVTPIGGADMPVVIALLNSYSGIAAAATGFVINNTVLIIAGALVGASGIILTQIMCKAMNRSLTNVLFGGMGVGGPPSDKKAADAVYANVKAASPEELAMVFDGVQRVVIVPGYGMAVAQAQHAVRDLANLLESRGTTVDYAIHPVAGRMPGHMNVLLAEADVPYDKMKEIDQINGEIAQVDVAIVIGANDTVNPVARSDPRSPIAGMPIIDVDKARTVIVIKRSLSPGFAGIPNPLFANPNTLMYFADGKKAVVDLINAMKAG
jgi:H+-translocating NAD(P) transhydrogenase subunit beta